MTITVGIEFHGQIVPLSMRFRNQGIDLVYCSPDEKAAADTAQVLRNLCLMVEKSAPEDWQRIVKLMQRLFNVTLDQPKETSRGAIDLRYKQPGVREALDVSSSGRGFQQMLLIFAYLYSHKGSVLLVDEPDAHLEILRQKQVYVLLRDIASENRSQVVMVTHSTSI